MSSEAELVIKVWEIVRDHVPNNKRSDVATELLYAFAEFGFEASDVEAITEEDAELDDAFTEVFPPDDEEVDE